MTAPPADRSPGRGGVGDDSGRVRTVAADVQGPLHTGDGDQINSWVEQVVLQLQSASAASGKARVRAVGLVTREEVSLARDCFVHPTGFEQAERTFADSRLAVLSGPHGSGRRTAAVRLLDDGSSSSVDIRVLLPGPDDQPPFLDADAVEPRERLLLELPEVDDRIVDQVRKELPDFRHAVAQREGHLVIVASDADTDALRKTLRVAPVPIERPDPEKILRRHLGVRRLGDRSTEIAPAPLDDSVRARLDAYPADEAARLAALVAHLVRSQPDTDAAARPLGELVETAMDGAAHWTDAVSRLVKATGGFRQRAVLLSAAMFNGCSTDAAFEAAEVLLSHARPPEWQEQEEGLARQGFIAQLEGLHVQVKDRSIRFTGLGYDTAVRNRFWDEFPDHHDTFREWVEQCAQPAQRGYRDYTALDPTAIAVLGQRFAEQHLRTRGVQDLVKVVNRWISGGDGSPQKGYADLVLGALEAMLRDEQTALLTRRHIRDWARAQPARPIAYVLIGLCEKALALTHPPQAIVRLRHLARHWDARVAEEARDSLMRLAERDRLVHRTLISVVAERMEQGHRGGRPIHEGDCELLRLATSPTLLRAHGEHAPVVTCRERAALTAAMAADIEEVRTHAERWLTAYALDPPRPMDPARGTALPGRLGAVADAAFAAGRWSTLYGAVVRWRDDGPTPPYPQRRREVADMVVGHIRVARRSGGAAGSRKTPTPEEA